jgi:SAM-dependent methyltransferase
VSHEEEPGASGLVSRESARSSHHVARNREAWDVLAAEYVEPGREAWGSNEPFWGIWRVPESQVGFLPNTLEGRDVLELGCGAGYVSAWLARRGARPVGLDLSTNQLASAAGFQREFDIRFPLVQADAEAVPLQSESFDLIVSEYGASIWCDPYRWVPEAARLLHPGGELIFMVNGTILMLCVPTLESEGPATERLLRPYFGMHRFEWPEDPSIDFHLGYGEWIRLLRANGFDVTDLIEVRPPEDATTRYPFVTLEWARQWPCEEVWKARKRG